MHPNAGNSTAPLAIATRPRQVRLAHHRSVLVRVILGALIAMAIGYLFRSNIDDFMQQDSDAAYFFETASSGAYDFSLDASILTNENSLPLIAYGAIYNFFGDLGIRPDPALGILFNALLVVASQLVILAYARQRFGFDAKDSAKLALLMSFNGVLMMFAGIHMRDAFLLLTATLSVLAFHPRAGVTKATTTAHRFLTLLILMTLSFLCRKEGFAVPLLVYLISSLLPFDFQRQATRIKMLILLVLGLYVLAGTDVIDLVLDNYEAYKLLSQGESASGSLAYFLLYELPLPISILAGNILLLFIKIPFWRGMFFDSYSFYMSMAAVQMIFVAPTLLAVAVYAVYHKLKLDYLYLLLLVLSLLFLTAITSNQVRHFSIIYPALFILHVSRRRLITGAQQHRYFGFTRGLSITIFSLSVLIELR